MNVRVKAPSGIGAVQTFSGRHINVGLDGIVEMSEEDAFYLIPAGWAVSVFRALSGVSAFRPLSGAQIFPPILLPSGFSPHLVSPMLSDTAWVSQTAEIAQFISGQALSALLVGYVELPVAR